MPIGKLQGNADRGLATTGRARSAKKLNNEVWLSLVERYVREQIADYERKIYKTAETP